MRCKQCGRVNLSSRTYVNMLLQMLLFLLPPLFAITGCVICASRNRKNDFLHFASNFFNYLSLPLFFLSFLIRKRKKKRGDHCWAVEKVWEDLLLQWNFSRTPVQVRRFGFWFQKRSRMTEEDIVVSDSERERFCDKLTHLFICFHFELILFLVHFSLLTIGQITLKSDTLAFQLIEFTGIRFKIPWSHQTQVYKNLDLVVVWN